MDGLRRGTEEDDLYCVEQVSLNLQEPALRTVLVWRMSMGLLTQVVAGTGATIDAFPAGNQGPVGRSHLHVGVGENTAPWSGRRCLHGGTPHRSRA